MISNNKDTDWKPTACNLCYANCGVLVQTKGRRITRVKGDKNHPASRGYTCSKALQLDYYQNGKDRLKSPLRRCQDGSYEEIDWDTAIQEIARKMSAIRDQHGGSKIFRYGGGGQGNHLGGAYFGSVKAALGIKYTSNALAQEKTGYAWMMKRTFGGHIHGELEHAQCLFIVGKNPWQSNGFQRARILLQQASKDPNRTLIVMDPRLTESAELADIHLAVKPGRDVWALSAMIAHIVQEDLVPHQWLEEHTTGYDAVVGRFAEIDVAAYSEFAGLTPKDVKATAVAIATSGSSAYYEDLGVQMAPHSTVASYLNLMLMAITGNYGRPNTMMPLKNMIGQFLKGSGMGEPNEAGYATDWKKSPVVGARVVGGLVPCNVIPEEILSDHPDRYRAMFIESSNPCHSLANSQSWRKAMRAMECTVVIDIAMTETARQADYVLPASSQYEKWESTFFNFEYPKNVHHFRKPLFEPLEGTLPEPEIHARLVEVLEPFDISVLKPLKAAAKKGLKMYIIALMLFMVRHRKLSRYMSYILYRTIGPTLPGGAAAGAVYLGLASRFATANPKHVKRAGFKGYGPMLGINLFKGILEGRSGMVFSISDESEAFEDIETPDKKISMNVGEMLDEVDELAKLKDLVEVNADFPFILTAGERRAYTANTAIRDPAWMKTNDSVSMAIHPDDARDIGVDDGGRVRIITKSGEAIITIICNKRMQRGAVSIPNGLGLIYPDVNGNEVVTGVSPNELTSLDLRDKFVGTPLHKHVPARLEAV